MEEHIMTGGKMHQACPLCGRTGTCQCMYYDNNLADLFEPPNTMLLHCTCWNMVFEGMLTNFTPYLQIKAYRIILWPMLSREEIVFVQE